MFTENGNGNGSGNGNGNGHKFYLRPDVQVEPLINQWPAWPHLIPPATAAMNIAYLHLRLMKSFIMAPQLHASTLKDKAMSGGLFMNLPPQRVNEVKELFNQTVSEQAHMIQLADAIKSLNEMLLNEAKGHSMESLYEKIPPMLKGYVELVYDLNNNPSARFIEGLLYHSPYYDPSRQSLNLSLINSDDRHFPYATPRFQGGQSVQIKIPFAAEGVDKLFSMKRVPQSFDEIVKTLGISADDHETFRTFFTTESPRPAPKYEGSEVRIRYLNHACLLIETKDVSILTDPLLAYEYDREMQCYSYGDLPEVINYALITHGHPDHLVLETLLQLRHKIETLIVPRSAGGTLEDSSLKLLLKNIGFKQVIEIDEMESIPIPGGQLVGLPFLGEHADLDIRSKMAHLVQLNGKSILCATDSRNVSPELYARIHEILGDIDVLFLGMECDGAPLSWMYGQLCSRKIARDMDQSRRLNGSDFRLGIQIVDQLHCRQAYVYAMGQEPWLSYLTSINYTEESQPIIESNKLVEACRGRNITSERLFGSREIFV
jgi:L-ascorbate metabolism protein UlaG (beta-lactamase superfamily)